MTTLIDWTQLGWCFAGSSAFVVWEIIQQVHRPGWHRAGLLFIGLVISLAANTYVSEKMGLPLQLCSAGLGALGYKVFTFGQKKTDKKLDKNLTEED